MSGVRFYTNRISCAVQRVSGGDKSGFSLHERSNHMKATRFYWRWLWPLMALAVLLILGRAGSDAVAQGTDRAAAEKAIRSYAQQHGIDMTISSPNYTTYMKNILM